MTYRHERCQVCGAANPPKRHTTCSTPCRATYVMCEALRERWRQKVHREIAALLAQRCCERMVSATNLSIHEAKMSTPKRDPSTPKRPPGRPRGTNLSKIGCWLPKSHVAALDAFAGDYSAKIGRPMDRTAALRLILTAGFQALGITTDAT